MSSPWFVRGAGKVYGPFDSAKLKQIAAAGKIAPTTEVAQHPNGPWVQAAKVKGLFVQPVAPSSVPSSSPAKVQQSTLASATTSSPAATAGRGYVESNLLPDERIAYRGHLHWLFFARPCLLISIAIALFAMGSRAVASDDKSGTGIVVIGVLVLLAGLLSAISRAIAYKTSEFAVTTRRVIMKQGFIRRKTIELLLGKIDSLAVEQGIFGRIFNFGTVRLTVATEKQSFPFLANPLEFRRQVQSQAID